MSCPSRAHIVVIFDNFTGFLAFSLLSVHSANLVVVDAKHILFAEHYWMVNIIGW